MNSIDLTPLYSNSIGFDQVASMLDSAIRGDSVTTSYPPYNIEVVEENNYAITLAVAGFAEEELDISVENGVLSVTGDKSDQEKRNYLHHGIANRKFVRKFNLADYVEVTGAELAHGLLTINLKKEIPEAMKPRKIQIGYGKTAIGHDNGEVANESETTVKTKDAA